MGHGDGISLMIIAELIHWIALGIMGLVYTARIIWLLGFKNAVDRSRPGLHGSSGMGPALHSLGNVAMPWAM